MGRSGRGSLGASLGVTETPQSGLASPKYRPKNRELTGKWRFLSLGRRDGGDGGSRNAQGGMLEAGRDVVGEGWDPAPQHPNSITLILQEGGVLPAPFTAPPKYPGQGG